MDDQSVALPLKPNNILITIGIAIAFILPLVISVFMGHQPMVYYDKLFYSRFIYWFTVLLLFFYAYQIEKQPLLIWRERKFDLGFFLLSVLVLYLLFIAAAIVSAIPTLLGLRENTTMVKKVTEALRGHSWMLFFVALTAGVTEEFIFRGYLLTRLTVLFKNQNAGIIISSLLFSAMHYSYGSLRELLFAFLIGVIFSIYYIKYRNIKALMFTHFLIDFISMNLAQHFKLK